MSLRWNGSGAGGHAWYALVAGAALLLACGARPGPEPLHEAGVFPDAGLPDAFVPSCELSFSACRVSAGPVKVGDKLDMPEGDWGAIEAVTEVDGDVVLLYGSWLPESDRNALWLVRLGQGAPSPAADLFRIDEAGNGADGTFLQLGGDVLLASATIHPSYVVTVAPLRLDSPDGPLGGDRLVAAQGFSRSPSMARTPRGFAIFWFEEATVQLAVYDCCVE